MNGCSSPALCARRGYRAQAREGPIKVISEQMTNVDGCYLALLYLGGYYLSSLLYDVNQQVALLQQLVFLPRRVHLDRSTDKIQSAICWVPAFGSVHFHKAFSRASERQHSYFHKGKKETAFFLGCWIPKTFGITTVAIETRRPVPMIILETQKYMKRRL